MMRRIDSRDAGFANELARLRDRGLVDFQAVEETVRAIIDDVRKRGDEALVEMAARFDRAKLTPSTLRVSEPEIEEACQGVSQDTWELLAEAACRIKSFHREQLRRSWYVNHADGTMMGQQLSAMPSAGLYVPGGRAAYPSTVLMNAIPAQVAGVGRLAICTPSVGGTVHPLVLAAARLLGIDEIYKTGGAQAVAAMAYGTAVIPRVAKIVGPGNIYVAAAKKAVVGAVSIDMVAGPSEVFVIADAGADARHIAADLLSQAEHDPMATCVLLTDDAQLADRVDGELRLQLAELSRREIAEQSLGGRGRVILTADIAEAVDLANELGPEHLEILTADPLSWLSRIRYAGSIFLGPHTPEALGDYLAGPNHVLPTGGAARFSSSLGVDDFLVRANVLCFSEEGFRGLAGKVMRFAELEGLGAHAASVRRRLPG